MKCRHCGNHLTLPILDLGHAPPSNAYRSEQELHVPESYFPLRLLVCENCWLVQTEDHAGREELFTKDYAYFSSFSTSWLTHAASYVQSMIDRFGLNSNSCVVEVAANDGYLLQYVQAAGIPCYGIEPTTSTAKAARSKGIEIMERFFGVTLADELIEQGRPADLIVANNVLAHVPDINDFVTGFTRLLKPSGVATFEFPHLLRLVQGNQFDTVYHEHYSYLSLTAVERIFSANGLTIFDVEQLPTHGGSLRVFAQRSDTGTFYPSPATNRILGFEQSAGMKTVDFYQVFQSRVEKVKDDFLCFLIESKRSGKRIAGYGAAAKGNTLLNFAGIRSDLLPYIVDKNPAKQGKFMPGNHIPIVKPEVLYQQKPDFVVILPWNIADEIKIELDDIRVWNGQFVVAIPELLIQ